MKVGWAVLKVGRQWSSEGLLDIDALYADHKAWLAQRAFRGLNAMSPVPVDISSINQISRLDLPPYVLFACLDVGNQGYLTEEALQKLEQWPSPVAHLVSGAELLYDPAGSGVVTYAHFRRFCQYLDRLRPCGSAELLALRSQVRQAIMHLSGQNNYAESASLARGLDGPVDMFGLMRLLESAGLTKDLAELFAGAFLAVRESSSFRAFLATAFKCQVLLRRHVDDLLKACFAASVDLESILESLLPETSASGAVLGWDPLLATLVSQGVDTSKMDAEEVACALDPSGRRLVRVADLLASAKAFKARHLAVLQNLAHRAHSHDGQGFLHLIALQKADGSVM